MRQKGFTPIIILLVLALMGAVGYIAYLKGHLNQFLNNSNLTTISPEPYPIEIPTITQDSTANWNTYLDNTYSFKYPSGWTVTPGSANQKEYWGGDSLRIDSHDKTVSINIAPGIFTYGFGGDVEKISNEISITIEGKNYNTTEFQRIEDGKTKVFVDLEYLKGNTEYHILFGTGYPVNDDSLANFQNYLKEKQTILQILSTLKILK